jgi:NADH-quinone oxidoreductase subunit C
MMALDSILATVSIGVPGARLELVSNEGPAGQSSLRVDASHAVEVTRFLRDQPPFQFDYASNVTGVDWPERTRSEIVLVKKMVDGVEQEFEQTVTRTEPGYLEVVYHLYSTSLRQGPLILRMRTENRTDRTHLPSLTPVWRGAEFQEREVYDLYGVVFDGHPDLRRILMWDEFQDYPMRKDYQEPDDYEYEPTPHGTLLEKAQRHYPSEGAHG